MMNKEIIVDGVDVSEWTDEEVRYNFEKHSPKAIRQIAFDLYKQLKRKEQECEELHARTASIIYSLTGGRLSYSTYTLEGCEDAYRDQLRIDVERATKELQEENETLKSENFAFEELIKKQEEQLDDDNVIIDRFLIASGKSKDITEPEEFEEVFQDIEQTYSEHEELNKKCEELKKRHEQYKPFYELGAKCTQLNEVADGLSNKCDKYKQVLDEIEKKSIRLTTENRKFEDALDEIKEIACEQRIFDLTGKIPLLPVIEKVGKDFLKIQELILKAKGSGE